MLLGALVLSLLALLLQADTTSAAGPVGPLGFVVGYVLSNVVPLITAWAFKKYNVGITWLAKQSNAVKMAIYVAGTVFLMFILQWIGLGFDRGIDIRNLGSDVLAKIVQALVATFLVKLGITTAREKTIKPLRSRTRRTRTDSGNGQADGIRHGPGDSSA